MAKTRMRELRSKHNWSMKYIAYYIGVSIQTISNWEKGETEPDLKSLVKLAELYNVTLDYLLYRDDYQPKFDSLIREVSSRNPEEIKEITLSFIERIANLDITKKSRKD